MFNDQDGNLIRYLSHAQGFLYRYFKQTNFKDKIDYSHNNVSIEITHFK